MCGIAGKISFNSQKVSSSDILKMTDKILHRGPDDGGFYISQDHKVGLGNRRLAILDLSSKGHQPMSYGNKYWITTNGEIYNFQEERRKLIKLGYKFKSNCDTEVILALYDRYKERCLEHLRGMFAFAIYDLEKQIVFLARDRIGVKPLKYYFDSKVFIFASELKAILTQKEVAKNIDFDAIQKYMLYGYVPSPKTGFKNIRKLEPGNYLIINLKTNSVSNHHYWEPVFGEKLNYSEEEWCREILHTLEESTKIRMISDVPIGAFLSGGVDSSAVVAIMAQLSKVSVKTFTITFEDKKLSEEKFARNIVSKYKTDHTELVVKPQNVELLSELAYYYEEPFADASSIVTYLVSKETKKRVTVALNGDGGDENFGGYPNRYLRLRRDVDYNNWISKVRPIATSTLKLIPKTVFTKSINRGLRFFEKSRLPLYERFASYNQIFSYSEILKYSRGILADDLVKHNIYGPIEKSFNNYEGDDLKDAGLKFDLLYWLPDQLLTKVDIASMAVALEARSPFLDHKMIELACKIPFKLKVKNNVPKYILKKALEKIVPKENLYRPKMGFTIPLDQWFTQELNTYSKSILLNGKAFVTNYFDRGYIKNMLTKHSVNEDYGPRLWSLLALELWFQNYFTK